MSRSSRFDLLTDAATVGAATDGAEVAWLVSKRAAAIRSRDAEYLASRFAPGAIVHGLPPLLDEPANGAVRADRLRAWFDGLDGRIRYRMTGLTVSVGGHLAFCHSVDELSVRMGRRRRVLRYDATLGFVRVGGVWLVASEHLRALE